MTIVTGKQRRVTLMECPNDLHSMMDMAKSADLILLLCAPRLPCLGSRAQLAAARSAQHSTAQPARRAALRQAGAELARAHSAGSRPRFSKRTE